MMKIGARLPGTGSKWHAVKNMESVVLDQTDSLLLAMNKRLAYGTAQHTAPWLLATIARTAKKI